MPPATATTPALSRRHRRSVIAVVVATQLVLALVSGVGTYLFYKKLDGNIGAGKTIDHLADPAPSGALNILVMGIDERDCAGCAIDREAGGDASDTTILVHVAADRRSAYGVSIPRDALVTRPRCENEQGDPTPRATEAMWNEAYSVGGPACTAKQLELLSGIHIDHYLTLNFAGFKGMVNAIDGVSVCIPEEIDDDAHHIHLPAGTHTLRDQDALNYVRQRVSTPNADLGRMKRQQYFISSMINKVTSTGMFARPDRLMGFADALTKSIETDPGIDGTGDLVDLALEVKDAHLQNITFVTLPTGGFPEGHEHWGRLRILPAADKLWQRIAEDRKLGRDLGSGAISTDDTPSSGAPSGKPSAPPTTGAGASSSAGSVGPSAPSSDPSPGPSSGSSGQPDDSISPEEAAENGLCTA